MKDWDRHRLVVGADRRFLTWLLDFMRLYAVDRDAFDTLSADIVAKDVSGRIKSQHLSGGLVDLNLLAFYAFTQVFGEKHSSLPIGFNRAVAERLLRHNVSSDINSIGISGFVLSLNAETIRAYDAIGCLDNALFGIHYVVGKYAHSIFHIEVSGAKGKTYGGTGFAVRPATTEQTTSTIIVTNRHVVDPENWNIQRICDSGGNEHKAGEYVCSDQEDLAAVILADAKCANPLQLWSTFHLLEDVVAIGFPFIARAKKPEIIHQSGEIIGTTETYDGESLLLISAPISPGSSGGPIINELGLVVGVATQSNEAQYEYGSSIHYAAVPGALAWRFLERVSPIATPQQS